jgi:lipoyl-dependent peroxiredoxin
MRAVYTAEATAHGGREGHVRSSDGVLDFDLQVPREMGGPGGAATNPEQLFAAGYAACFESALRFVAQSQKKPLKDASIIARVTLNLTDDKRYLLSVDLRGHVEGVSEAEAQALMRAAHEVCPYSRATRGNVEVRLLVGDNPKAELSSTGSLQENR